MEIQTNKDNLQKLDTPIHIVFRMHSLYFLFTFFDH